MVNNGDVPLEFPFSLFHDFEVTLIGQAKHKNHPKTLWFECMVKVMHRPK